MTTNAARYLHSESEMRKLFYDYPEAISNTRELPSQLKFEMTNLGSEFPVYLVPDGETMDYAQAGTGDGERLARCSSGQKVDCSDIACSYPGKVAAIDDCALGGQSNDVAKNWQLENLTHLHQVLHF